MTTALEVSASGKTRPKLLVRDMSAEGVTNRNYLRQVKFVIVFFLPQTPNVWIALTDGQELRSQQLLLWVKTPQGRFTILEAWGQRTRSNYEDFQHGITAVTYYNWQAPIGFG